MKKKTRFASQLLMFSNTAHEYVDNWFAGNVIFEIDLDGHEFDEKNEYELYLMTNLACNLFESYKKLTVVHNYSESGLAMACLQGHYKIFMLNSESDYKKLKHLHSTVENYVHTYNSLDDIRLYTNNSLNSFKKIKSSNAMPFIKTINSTTKKLIKQYDVIIDAFKADVNENFSACRNY